MRMADCLLNGQEHSYRKIHEKSIPTEALKSLGIVMISQPDLNKIPQDEEKWNSRESQKPVGSNTTTPHHFDKGQPRQQGEPDVEIPHPLFPKSDDEVLFPDGPIRFFVRKLIDQDHVEDGEANRNGEEHDLRAEEPREEKKAGCNGQPPITESDEYLPQTMVGPSNRLV